MLEELQPLLDFAFLEPCSHPEYIGFYHNYSQWKMLDNGYIERNNHSLSLEPLLQYSASVNAHCTIAPDHLGNWYFNLKNTKALCDAVGRDRTACVLSGPTPWEFIEQAQEAYSWAAILCAPFRLNRAPLPSACYTERYHLLGLKIPEDYSTYRPAPGGKVTQTIFSLDSSEPLNSAYHYWPYAERGFACFKRPLNYENLSFSRTQLDIAKSNIIWLKRLLHTNAFTWA